MPHEKLSLDGQVVQELFPFHLLISAESHRRLLSAGSAIKRLLPQDYLERSFDEFFCITRPSLESLSMELIETVGDRIFFVSVVGSNTVLRGQLIANSPGSILFLGTLLVTAANSLDASGFSLGDFAPYDTTPEILILHRFREMQIKGMEQQNLKLQNVIEARDTLDKYANTDELTGIANRRGFWSMGSKWLEKYNDSATALLVMDLDRFKGINDNFGHDAGDALLQATGRRLSEALQADGLPGRIGGDEFVAIVKAPNLPLLKKRITDIAGIVTEPVLYNGAELVTQVSTGVIVADGMLDIDELVSCADLAMYDGRSTQRGQVCWYSVDIKRKREYDQRLIVDLEKAIDDRLLRAFYQPVIRMSDHEIVSFEVLARWEHPEIGFISPEIFIQLAQKAGLLRRLDCLMLELSLDQLAVWQSQGKDYTVHVNICGPSIHPDLPGTVREHLDSRGIEPAALHIELTETTLIDDSEAARAILTELTDIGVKLLLDDFGTGFSSLTHLQDFPVSGVKIDRSFVEQAPDCKRARNLLFAIADIATHLELSMVGEGIETEEQFELLQQLGCHYGQGFLLGRPAEADSCEQLSYGLRNAA